MASGPGNRDGLQPKKLSSHAKHISPTATQNTPTAVQKPPQTTEHITDIVPKTAAEITPDHAVSRQLSVIPAYHYNDTTDQLDLDYLLGTPYTCELVEAKKKEKKKSYKNNKAAKKNEKKQENSLQTLASPPPPAAAPPADLEDNPQQGLISALEHDESNDLIASMATLSLNKPAPLAITTNTMSTPSSKENIHLEKNNHKDILKNSHIRFDDSPENRVYLRGLPVPTGKHTTFEEN